MIEGADETCGVIPQWDKHFVPTQDYKNLLMVGASGMFYPILFTGPSGAGKTMMVEMCCAERKHEMFRVNLTIETDEDALMGGYRLKDGNTVFEHGPVVKAMQQGAMLLLDEVDLASPTKIMCLQSVIEGRGYYVKRTKEWITPAKGFQITATANTKGLGDDTGSFIGTQCLNEAFLERFPLTFEINYPSVQLETRILLNNCETLKIKGKETFVNNIIELANKIRTSHKVGNQEFTLSTRRLVHILKAYSIWGEETTALEMCFNRFPTHTKDSFMQMFNAISPVSVAEQERLKKKAMEDLQMGNFRPFNGTKAP